MIAFAGLICKLHSDGKGSGPACPQGSVCKHAGAKNVGVGICTYKDPNNLNGDGDQNKGGVACLVKRGNCHQCSGDGQACTRCYNSKYLQGGVCVVRPC